MVGGSQPRVDVVILNTNRREDSLECLKSLSRSTYPHVHVTVLDNASIDGSVDAIIRECPEVHVVPLTDNRGYAGNNNVGIRLALDCGAAWVLVLNEDTVVDPSCVSELVKVGESDERIGIVGPLVYHYQEPDIVQSAGGQLTGRWEAVHRGINERDTGQFAESADVAWISGCAILVRRAVIEQVGMLDERYFYYWEETDWCLRARIRLASGTGATREALAQGRAVPLRSVTERELLQHAQSPPVHANASRARSGLGSDERADDSHPLEHEPAAHLALEAPTSQRHGSRHLRFRARSLGKRTVLTQPVQRVAVSTSIAALS